MIIPAADSLRRSHVAQLLVHALNMRLHGKVRENPYACVDRQKNAAVD